MALFLGNAPAKKLIYINGKRYKFETNNISNFINSKLTSLDGYILKDKNNLFITSTEEDENKWQ